MGGRNNQGDTTKMLYVQVVLTAPQDIQNDRSENPY